MVRFKGGVERRSRGQEGKIERAWDGAEKDEIKGERQRARDRANALKANKPCNYLQFFKKKNAWL